MRRTWIGAATAAGLSVATATGFAIAQEQAPAGQQMERDHNRAGGAEQGQRREGAQAQSPAAEQKRGERAAQEKTGQQNAQEKMGQQKMGEQPGRAANEGKAPSEGGKSAQGAQKTQQERANQAQTEKNRAEGADKASRNQSTATDAGKTAAPATGASQAETSRPATQNARQAEGQNTRAGQRVDPQKVHAQGNANLSNDKAAQIANNLIPSARPQNVNVNIGVGAALPSDIELAPLPPDIVDIVPEYRDYDYVVANDEIVIVQPSTRNVVEVINTGGGMAMNAPGSQTMAGGGHLNPCGP
jgi:hypothetical protein